MSELFARSGYVAGVDEVGRGALFGPVVAAAVVLPQSALPQLSLMGVKDSKQLSAKKRVALAQEIKQLVTNWQIGYASVQEIDEINILRASLLAMKRAVIKLKFKPEICLVDGNQTIPELFIPQENIVKGDQLSPAIAAASIIAKVWRDELILRWAKSYPNYDLTANKGYGTERHRQALLKYGPSPQHRMSFSPCQVTVSH